MLGDAVFNRVKRSDHKAISEISAFLRSNDLNIDTTVEVFITVTQHDKLVACGGIADNIIKCVAISPLMRGEGLALALATELVNLAYERHHTQLFIYTKVQNEPLFRQCGFYPIATVPGIVVLMENSPCRLKRYAAQLASQRRPGDIIGSIVMNANPFTRGHQYLVRQAAKRCDWLHLFLVKENTSRFSYEDRRRLVLAGTADIPNLRVHEGSQYVISRATFPVTSSGSGRGRRLLHRNRSEDLPPVSGARAGITHRFVGNEPFCAVTAKYNRDMRYWLETPALPSPPIALVEIERLQYQGTAISASWAQAAGGGDFHAAAPLVPPDTLYYLQDLQTQRRAKAAPHPLSPHNQVNDENYPRSNGRHAGIQRCHGAHRARRGAAARSVDRQQRGKTVRRGDPPHPAGGAAAL